MPKLAAVPKWALPSLHPISAGDMLEGTKLFLFCCWCPCRCWESSSAGLLIEAARAAACCSTFCCSKAAF